MKSKQSNDYLCQIYNTFQDKLLQATGKQAKISSYNLEPANNYGNYSKLTV